MHLIHAADGMFPSDMACGTEEGIDEERRLLYVALTRARDVLEINVPLRYYVHRQPGRANADRHLYAQVSRFLTPAVRDLMATEHAGAPGRAKGASPARGPHAAGPGGRPGPGDMTAVDQFLSRLWA